MKVSLIMKLIMTLIVFQCTSELAARKIGQSEVGAPAGELTITGCGATAAIEPRGSREGKRKKRKPPLTREKENPCSRSHARNSERGADKDLKHPRHPPGPKISTNMHEESQRVRVIRTKKSS